MKGKPQTIKGSDMPLPTGVPIEKLRMPGPERTIEIDEVTERSDFEGMD